MYSRLPHFGASNFRCKDDIGIDKAVERVRIDKPGSSRANLRDVLFALPAPWPSSFSLANKPVSSNFLINNIFTETNLNCVLRNENKTGAEQSHRNRYVRKTVLCRNRVVIP